MFLIQMTGLSGAGKSTLASRVQQLLRNRNLNLEVIDGDVYRKTVCSDLGFTVADRKENIRRLAAVANQFLQNNIPVLISAINPFEDIREELKNNYQAKVVWIKCDLDVLKKRDTKGLYRLAELPDSNPDKIRNLTGVNHPYEIPIHPDIIIDTTTAGIDTSAEIFLDYLLSQFSSQQV